MRGGIVLTSPLEKGLACPFLWSVMTQVPQPSAEETNSANPCPLLGFLSTWQGARARIGWAGGMSTWPQGMSLPLSCHPKAFEAGPLGQGQY